MKNRLVHINVSNGGVPKLPIPTALVDELGIVGDKQKDKRYHGGVERAICLFDLDLIQQLKCEGHPIEAGTTGENFTIRFENFAALIPGVKLAVGNELILEITSYAAPCKTIQHSFLDLKFTRISQKLYPQQSRLYAKVIKGGWVKVDDEIRII